MTIFNSVLKSQVFEAIDFATLLGREEYEPLRAELRAMLKKGYAEENLRFAESLFAIHQQASSLSPEAMHHALLTIYRDQIDPQSPEITVNLPDTLMKALARKINNGESLVLADFDPAGKEILFLISHNLTHENISRLKSILPEAEEKYLNEVKAEARMVPLIDPEDMSKLWKGVHGNYKRYKKENSIYQGRQKGVPLNEFDQALRELKKAIEHFFPEESSGFSLGKWFHSTKFTDVLRDENRLSRDDVTRLLDRTQQFARVCSGTDVEAGSHQAFIRDKMLQFSELLEHALHTAPSQGKRNPDTP